MSDAEDRLRLMGLSVGAELATLMVELFGGGGGQMQTPWEQDIDGAQYSLGNVSHIGILNNDEEIDPVFRIEQTVTYDQPYSAPIDSQCSASIQYFPSADMGSGETSFPTGFFVNTDAQSVLQAATGHTTITGGYFLTGCTGPSPESKSQWYQLAEAVGSQMSTGYSSPIQLTEDLLKTYKQMERTEETIPTPKMTKNRAMKPQDLS